MTCDEYLTMKLSSEMLADIEAIASRRGIHRGDAARELLVSGITNVQQIMLFDQRQGHELVPPLSKGEQYKELCKQLARLELFTESIK
jgi:hypothetical protein